MTEAPGAIPASYRDAGGTPIPIDPAVLAAVRAVAGEPAPARAGSAPIPLPPRPARSWGWQVQLYQLRSARSWGIGDYADLADLARGLGAGGAAMILINPVHAETPAPPYLDSPYSPSSRRFISLLSLSIPQLPEYQGADAPTRAAVDQLAPPNGDRIERPRVWAAKLAALALLFPGGEAADWAGPGGERLLEFGVFCALAGEHGRDWRAWPEPLRRPGAAASAAADPARVALHVWAQARAAQQLAAAQQAALDAGMSVGIVHDLAVGVDPGGADGWVYADALADGVSIGAPPDAINEQGQNWGLPAWRPDRLAAAGFAPWRDVVAAALRLGGGLRIDHIMGLSRMWWIPAGVPIGRGAYVYGDSEAMFGVLVAEAGARGSLLIGEDLGVVEPGLRDRMGQLGILGSAVLWFEGMGSPGEGDDDGRLPANWRARAAASVSTHDLPTAHGFLRDAQVHARAAAGVLGGSLENALAEAAKARVELIGLLIRCGALDPADVDDPNDIVHAMYRALIASPSQVVLVGASDAVGDLRQPNLPGTVDEYPNWRLPLADGAGNPVSLERFLASPGVAQLSALMRSGIGRSD